MYLFNYLFIPSCQNILFDVLTGGETEETPVVSPPSEQESEPTEPETADDPATATGEAVCRTIC